MIHERLTRIRVVLKINWDQPVSAFTVASTVSCQLMCVCMFIRGAGELLYSPALVQEYIYSLSRSPSKCAEQCLETRDTYTTPSTTA